MDPAAFATAHIGLEAIRRREAAAQPRVAPRARPRRRSAIGIALRSAIAAALRTAATAIEAQPQEHAGGT